MKKSEQSSIVKTYNQILENLYNLKNSVEDASRDDLAMKLDYAKNKFHDIENITKEEIDLVTEYLHKDITAATTYVNKTKNNIKEWLKKDIELTEDRLLHLFVNVVDQSRVELQQMETLLHEWHSGEVTNRGTLECNNCGEKILFSDTQVIKNCLKCNGTVFHKDFDF
jgi:hypothetical protein